MKQTLQRGFTLIELLVVIAIIGILASVVLASLNSAREKGADAAASSSLNNARAQAELYYSEQDPNSYEGVCAGGASANGIAANIQAATDAIPTSTTVCGDTDGAWAASIQLNDTNYYCVDSTGFGGSVTTDPAIVDDTAASLTCA